MKHQRLFTILIILGFILDPSRFAIAETAESVNQQIANTNAQIQALDREIKQYQDQISETSQQSNTLANLIKELTLTRTKLTKEKEQTQKQITATGLVIGALSSDIDAQLQAISRSKESLKKMLKDLNQSDSTTMIEQFLSQESLADASREYNNTLTINEEVRKHIDELNIERNALVQSKTKKEDEQGKLTVFKKTLVQKEIAVTAAKKEKDTLLAETKNQESAYKKLLADREKKRDLFEKDLESYEAKLKFILNPNLLPTEGSGVLSWPLDTVFITQLFGKTVAAKRLYVSGSHSGVDFRASVGTPVKSMATGTVIGTGDTDLYCKGASFGKWVFIKYDNGLSSTFGHLSVIQATTNQKVSTGDIVGLSGNTGHSTGPHLHVTVYASQGADVKTVPSLSCSGKTFIMPIASTSAYLDPMSYLPPIAKAKVKNDVMKD
jgi:murein DD-endopeptidase MepM/ murein hydrolase activator NlpD